MVKSLLVQRRPLRGRQWTADCLTLCRLAWPGLAWPGLAQGPRGPMGGGVEKSHRVEIRRAGGESVSKPELVHFSKMQFSLLFQNSTV